MLADPTVTPPASQPRGSGRFIEPEESVYHARKFEELKRYGLRTILFMPPLIVGLWIWDWVIDPAAAPHTLWLRVGMAACLLPCIAALRSPRVTPRAYTVLFYASVVATEFFFLAILRRLEGGMVYGIGGYMFYVLGLLVVSLPLGFWDNVIGISVALLVPNLAALAGLLPGFEYARFNTLLVPAVGLSFFTLWAFDRVYRRLFTYQRDVEQLAGEDALTGIPNRRQFMRAGEQMFEGVRRYGRTASLLMIDLDHFKSINDRYGHAAGDAVLQAVGRLLLDHQRGADLSARMGGEEFAMLLPETDLAGAVAVGERLRGACEALRVGVPGGIWAGLALTMSLGATRCSAEDRSLDDTLRRADAALYRAKHGGRNRVEQ